jgi:hypothetical protein
VTHLGDRASALVDGQLSMEGTERAHQHLAHCRECRDAVESERLMKARLAGMFGPAPDEQLMGRLLALGGPAGPLPPREARVPGSPRLEQLASLGRFIDPGAKPVATGGTRVSVRVSLLDEAARSGRLLVRSGLGERRLDRPAGRGTSRRPAPAVRPTGRTDVRGARYLGSTRPAARARLLAALGAFCVVTAGVGGLALAAPAAPAQVAPQLDSLVLEHAATTSTLPFGLADGWQPELAAHRSDTVTTTLNDSTAWNNSWSLNGGAGR